MQAIFFPRKDYDVEICPHRLGKQMTYTEQTDGLNFDVSYSQFMALAKARNIKVGAFASYYELNHANINIAQNDKNNGYLWVDEYSLCPSLYDKITHYESPTEQEFISAYNSELLPNFISVFGKKPVALSYLYGQEGFRNAVCPLYLGARNSAYNGNTDYGVGYGNPSDKDYSFTRYCSKVGTTRWYDYAKVHGNDFAGSLSLLSSDIDTTMQNGGWLNNFTHWHNYWQDHNEQWAETYLNLLQTKNVNDQIYFAGYGEAVAYLVFRQMITRSVMYSPLRHHNTQLIIRLETSNTFGVDPDLLQIPISVKFSTIGTPLAGKKITSNCNLISKGVEDYVVEIPYIGQFPFAVIKAI